MANILPGIFIFLRIDHSKANNSNAITISYKGVGKTGMGK